MVWWTAVFLGLIQGIAEFLPISSSGHLMLFEHYFNIESGGLLFNIILHLATLLAVCTVYHKKIWNLVRHPFCKYNTRLLVATVITCAFVLIFKDVIDAGFNVRFLPFAFIVTAAVLLLPAIIKPKASEASTAHATNTTDKTNTTNATNTTDKINKANKRQWLSCIAMGLAQGLAVVPAFSRSGFTITAGQLSGMEKSDSADFSFLMSVPIIIASLLYEIAAGGEVVAIGMGNIIIAFAAAFVSGLVAIRFMLNMLRKIDLRWFSAYLFVLGACLLLFL